MNNDLLKTINGLVEVVEAIGGRVKALERANEDLLALVAELEAKNATRNSLPDSGSEKVPA